jgi:DNA-binding NarL/FixJ family response regulator
MDRLGFITVFVVEDSPAIRAVLTQRLEDDARFTVLGHAATAKDAIAALQQHMPEILVLDLHLAQGTGYDVLAHLRRSEVPAGFQAIVFTNYASPAHRQRALELGASSFFDKSMQFDDMLDALRLWADEKERKNPGVPLQ